MKQTLLNKDNIKISQTEIPVQNYSQEIISRQRTPEITKKRIQQEGGYGTNPNPQNKGGYGSDDDKTIIPPETEIKAPPYLTFGTDEGENKGGIIGNGRISSKQLEWTDPFFALTGKNKYNAAMNLKLTKIS